MEFLTYKLIIIVYPMFPGSLLGLLSFRRKNFAKIKKNYNNHFKRIWPLAKKLHLLRLFLSRHGSPCGYRTLIYCSWDISWPERLNPANTSEHCFDRYRLLKSKRIFNLIFWRKSWFSPELLAENLWKFNQIYL